MCKTKEDILQEKAEALGKLCEIRRTTIEELEKEIVRLKNKIAELECDTMKITYVPYYPQPTIIWPDTAPQITWYYNDNEYHYSLTQEEQNKVDNFIGLRESYCTTC